MRLFPYLAAGPALYGLSTAASIPSSYIKRNDIAIQTCPTSETPISFGPQTFTICPKSDYRTGSINVINNVNSDSGCAQACAQTSGCTNAVHDNTYNICHIKPSNTPVQVWATSQSGQYDSMRLFTGSVKISTCASTSNTTVIGSTSFTVCPNSDYQVGSTYVKSNVNSIVDCMGICVATQGCSQGVFDKQYHVCHVKGSNPGVAAFYGNPNYDSFQLSSSTPPTSSTSYPSASTATSVSVTTMTSSSSASSVAQPSSTACATYGAVGGQTFSICSNTDYQGTTYTGIPNIVSASACADACSKTTGCLKAVFDPISSQCYTKANGLVTSPSTRYTTVTVINATYNPNLQNPGFWKSTVQFPLSPAAGAILPQTGNVLVWSSGAPDRFGLDGEYHQTYASLLDLSSLSTSEIIFTEAHSDMFCPGTSMDFNGQLIVTGGSASDNTSVHPFASNGVFTSAAHLQIPRGYHSQVTLSNGKVFTIGGSWSGGLGGKDGEVYDGSSWTRLPGCSATPMLTNDDGGVFRSDNHAWLFAWKGQSVLQAGPSTQMNWYTTTGSGSVSKAGSRSSGDAMCGVAAMYDAVAGKVLTAGGSPDYNGTNAINAANVLTLGNAGSAVGVKAIPPMKYSRIFANSIVLPDGNVMIAGGQSFGYIFSDMDSTTIPELYNSTSGTFRTLADAGTGRTYHSFALLLQDATVLSAGGGLCRDQFCTEPEDMHNDGQIFVPPYLLLQDGKTLAPRPTISNAPSAAKVGGTMVVSMANADIGITFSLVRISSTTHTVNTDQRRVPVTGQTTDGMTFTMTLPNDPGVLVPGYYYVFALSNGVPSVAKIVQITN